MKDAVQRQREAEERTEWLEGMAEYYSVELSQKIRRGLTINAEKCICTGGGIALGFYVDSEKRF